MGNKLISAQDRNKEPDEGHPHADSMEHYAKDAQTMAYPWKNWQISDGDEDWHDCIKHPEWNPRHFYRRKPRTLTLAGIDFPEPVQEPLSFGDRYYFTDATRVRYTYWDDVRIDYERMEAGVIQETEEGAYAQHRAKIKVFRGKCDE